MVNDVKKNHICNWRLKLVITYFINYFIIQKIIIYLKFNGKKWDDHMMEVATSLIQSEFSLSTGIDSEALSIDPKLQTLPHWEGLPFFEKFLS